MFFSGVLEEFDQDGGGFEYDAVVTVGGGVSRHI
jgi:hypothetical protein